MQKASFPSEQKTKKASCSCLLLIATNDYWYYIDHTDITSKRALGLIIVLFRLQAPTSAGAAPILSLPTG